MNPFSVRIRPRLAIGTGLFLITAFFYLTININEINNKLLPSYMTPDTGQNNVEGGDKVSWWKGTSWWNGTSFFQTPVTTPQDNDPPPPSDQHVRMEIPMCNCQKWILKSSSRVDDGMNDFFNRSYSVNDTTCAPETFLRGPGQKAISFLYFAMTPNATKIKPPGTHIDIINWQSQIANYLNQADADDEDVVEQRMEERKIRGYMDGIRENFELVKQFYPGYTMRLYADLGGPIGSVTGGHAKSILCDLACREPQFDICDIYDIPKLGNASVLYPLLWRFLPAIDRQIDVFFSRDLDSRINDREAAAVKEFVASDESDLHVMRDHPAHGAFLMGGLWGAKVKNIRRDLILAFKDMFSDGVSYFKKENGFGYDQHILTRYIWHWAKFKAMQHDSYTCKKFSGTRPFPTRRKEFQVGNYVGSIVRLNASTEAECPEKCRPIDHKDWIKC